MKRRSGNSSGTRSASPAKPKAAAARKAKSAKTPVSKGRGGVNFSRRRTSSKVTIDHDTIRRWAESRGGKPATVRSTKRGDQAAGIIRLDFPGYSGARSLKPITWDEWFEQFESRSLALLYQEKTAGGKPSRFNKLVSRD